MPRSQCFDHLMARLRAGDQEAAAEIFSRFTSRLISLARSRLGRTVRRKVDPEDVVQSVYKSFFLRAGRGRVTVHSWDSMWGMLAVITIRKCGRQIERFRAARRDVRCEVEPAVSSGGSPASWEAVAREPTPAEAAVLAETVEELMRGLEPEERQVLTLALQGYTVREISVEVGRAERTVRRVLERARRRMRRMQERQV